MKAISPRICSIILLVVAMLALSGVAATVDALVHADDAIACCDNDSNDKGSGSGPCSVPDCLCAFCLTIEFAALPTISSATAAAVDFNPHQQLFPPAEFISAIDYPPEIF